MKEAKNCWEFWNCEKKIKEKCPAYKFEEGKECWLIASHSCPKTDQGKINKPKTKREFKYCWECTWFKKK